MGAALFQTHLLEDMGHRVAHRRGGSQGQIHNAEGHAQTAAGFGAHQLTHTGDLEGGLLDDVGDFVNGQGLVHLGKGGTHNTGAGYAHMDDTVGLTHAVEGTRHEGVVLRSVAEHHQLGTADALLVGSELGGLLDDLAHELDGVQVEAGLGGADVH